MQKALNNRKQDRRTLYTLQVIKDSFLKLIKQKPFSKITVAELCREADITRSTFYLHYSNISDVLNAVLDDALQLSGDISAPHPTRTDYSFNYLKENESMIPACQRIGDSEKYQTLLMDPDLTEYIVGRIMAHEKDKVIPSLVKKTGLSEEDAETLFLYVIHGSFAVNRAHHFQKDIRWSHDVNLLNKFTEAGYKGLNK